MTTKQRARRRMNVAFMCPTCPARFPSMEAYREHRPCQVPEQEVVVVGPNLPRQAKATFHVHAVGCKDLKRGWIAQYTSEAWTTSIRCHLDLEAEVYDFAPEENEGYELGDYLSEFHFAPCVTVPEHLEAS